MVEADTGKVLQADNATYPWYPASVTKIMTAYVTLKAVKEGRLALDAVTEAKVNAALDEVMRGRTTFVIAHRLSTIRNATRILVFDAGRVIESGTFDELVAKGGRFAELAKAQFMVQESARAGIEAKIGLRERDHG